MALREKIQSDIKEAMKAKDNDRLTTLRMMMAEIKNRDIQARGQGNADGLDDAGIMGLMQTMIKQRKESIEVYKQGGRAELADKEQAEIGVIEAFLPQMMDGNEMRLKIADVMTELNAEDMKDMGRVVKELKERYPGQMDMGQASAVIKQLLS